VDWSYLAGFIDGEGSIIIFDNPRNRRVTLSIPNTDKEVMLKIHKFLQYGTLIEYDRKPNKWKIVYIYKISEHKTVLKILKKLEPFLITKKSTCTQAIKYIENKKWRGTGGIFDITTKELIKMHKTMSLRAIGRKFNCSHVTVLRLLKN